MNSMFNMFDDQGKAANPVAQAQVQIRMGFIRKVYGILSVQLMTTFLSAFLFSASSGLKAFVRSSDSLVFLTLIGSVVCLLGLFAYRRQYPMNFVLLGIFTLLESFIVGVVTSSYQVPQVMEAVLLTAVVTVSVTLYAFQTKRDFTMMGGMLMSFLMVLIVAGFIQVFFQEEIVNTLIAVGGAILFSFFIIFDTQLLMKKFSPEDYIIATINLYLDIINLFLEILKIVGRRDR